MCTTTSKYIFLYGLFVKNQRGYIAPFVHDKVSSQVYSFKVITRFVFFLLTLSTYQSLTLCCESFQVIIVSPTRELTLQIFNEARKFSYGSILKIAVAYGGTAVRHQGDNIAVSR